MYLIDTNVLSEPRKGQRANFGVISFFKEAKSSGVGLFVSVVTLGEIRRGVESIRYRGDILQAEILDVWLDKVLSEYKNSVLAFGKSEAQLWGRLQVPHYENAIDKQIAATALLYDLTLVTRNTKDFKSTGVKLFNPFS